MSSSPSIQDLSQSSIGHEKHSEFHDSTGDETLETQQNDLSPETDPITPGSESDPSPSSSSSPSFSCKPAASVPTAFSDVSSISDLSSAQDLSSPETNHKQLPSSSPSTYSNTESIPRRRRPRVKYTTGSPPSRKSAERKAEAVEEVPRGRHLGIYKDPYNAAKRGFYEDQDPRAKLMIAGLRLYSKRPCTKAEKSKRNACSLSSYKQEEHFASRPSIRLVIPDHLKSLLVDDWENVTKNLQLAPLPSKTPVNYIMNTYFEEEKKKRRSGSAEADILEEVVQGVKEYFEKCLGRILLYRFEREQFFELRKMLEKGSTGEWEGKGVGDIYGAEHLCRLFGKYLCIA
jgi:hypothetical protein